MFDSYNKANIPGGVPLDDLRKVLESTSLPVSRKGDTLIVQHENLTSTVTVTPPANLESENRPISAVVEIKTPLPEPFHSCLSQPKLVSAMNKMATLGALVTENDDYFIGSRLTIFEGEDAWNIHALLLVSAITVGIDSMIGATRRTLNREEPETGPSEWTEDDLSLVQSYLSKISVCNAGGHGLTAEFGLKADAISAVAGDHETALWQLFADQPHPDLGGGLFCLLNLPQQIPDEGKLDRILNQLNQMEMQPHDLPPHFGAWCRGNLGNNPAYVSFLPNALHVASGIALNVSIWAYHRAQLADAMLATLGVRA
jgi:hypothetical protein